MNSEEIRAKAQLLVDQHIKDIREARSNLVKDMISAGYDQEAWVVMDNLEEIKRGESYKYICWASKKLPEGGGE